MEASEIKNKIFTRTVNLIGAYRHNNVSIPAIWIGNPPQDFLCSGLEIIVSEFPENSVLGNQIITEYWKITLTQYEGTETLQTATKLIRHILKPNKTFFLQRPKSTTTVQDLLILPQAIITYEHREIYET